MNINEERRKILNESYARRNKAIDDHERVVKALYEGAKEEAISQGGSENDVDWMLQPGLPRREPEFPLTVNAVTFNMQELKSCLATTKVGSFVSIKPVNDDKTYLGIYIGEKSTGLSYSFDKDTGIMEIRRSGSNPMIWVPDLARIVMGYESWWGEIKSPDDIKQITDESIQNVWYIKMLKAMHKIPEREDD